MRQPKPETIITNLRRELKQAKADTMTIARERDRIRVSLLAAEARVIELRSVVEMLRLAISKIPDRPAKKEDEG